MIRALAALTRQAQEFFHSHLVGLYRWEDVEFMPLEKNVRVPPEQWVRTSRGKRIRPAPMEGRHKAERQMRFGIWDLTIAGPSDEHPIGWLVLSGHETIEGPLDMVTWKRFGDHIKQHHEEIENVV
jgi:hypothetical protein